MWLQVKDLAEREGLSRQTIQKYIREGRYEKVRLTPGGHYRVWIDNGEPEVTLYCRVSTSKQKSSLESQAKNEAIQVAQKISTTASIVMDKDASIVDKGKAVVETLQEAEKAVRPMVENTKKHIEVHKRTKEATKTLEKSTKKIREERKEALKKIEERRASQPKVEEKPLEKEEVDVLQEFATNFDEGLEP